MLTFSLSSCILILALFECDNFIVTPHLGAQTVDASRDIGAHIIGKVKEALDLK